MARIKLIDVRMMVLRAAMKKEAQRLQDVANQVSRISAGLDMDLKASAGIEEILARLRKNLKNQSSNWTTMQQLAESASADLHQKDEELARKASGLEYAMRQFTQKAQTSALGANLDRKWVQDVPSLGLSALSGLNAAEKLGGLFDAAGSGLSDALRGVSLGELTRDDLSTLENFSTAAWHDRSTPDFLGDLDAGGAVTGLGVGAAGAAGIAGLATLFDKKSSASPAIPAGAAATTGRSIDINKEDMKKIFRAAGEVTYDVATFVPRKIGEAKVAAETWVDEKQAEHDAYIAAQEEKAAEMTKETGREYGVSSISGKIYDVEEHEKYMEEKRKEREERLANRPWYEKAADALVDSDFGEAVLEMDQKIKDFANSKPVEYAGDALGSAVSGGADLFSFVGNFGVGVATGNWAPAAADLYSFSNNYISFCQDTTALGNYAIGAGLEGFGYDDAADYYYNEAEVYAGREGIADELHGNGLDAAGTIVDFTDFGVGVYKTTTGATKLKETFEGMSWTNLDEVGDNLFKLSGWKNVDDVSNAVNATERFKEYKNISSNVKLGYKYVDAFLDGGVFGGDGLAVEAAKNTSLGKTATGIVGTAQSFLDVIKSAGEAGDN